MVKINQLFIQRIDQDLMSSMLHCFGLTGFSDRKSFSKLDMIHMNTLEKFREIVPRLRTFYIPCKAIMFLEYLSDKKSITVFRQCLRTYDFVLKSVERNHKNKKNIFYSIISKAESEEKDMIKIAHEERIINFQ